RLLRAGQRRSDRQRGEHHPRIYQHQHVSKALGCKRAGLSRPSEPHPRSRDRASRAEEPPMTEPRKRQSARELPRRIVRRTRPAVGQQRRIVRRKRDFKGGLVLEGSRWGSLFAWRPGKRATGVFAVVLTL